MTRYWMLAAMYSRKMLLAATMLLVGACAEDVNVSQTPTLEFVSIDRTQVISADETGSTGNTVILTFNFSDGDGDLGDGDTGSYDLRIVDKRPGFPFQVENSDGNIEIQDSLQRNSSNFEALVDSRNAISGTLRLTIRNIEFTPPRNAVNANPPPFPRPTQQTVQYNIQLVDRAGNRSAAVLTPPIQIDCTGRPGCN